MTDYSWITDDIFDAKLMEIMNRTPASHLLTVPGVYEAVREHFNNKVLDELEEMRRRSGKDPSPVRTYWVKLKYPDYLATDGDEYFSESTVAATPEDAVAQVRACASADNSDEDGAPEPVDFALVECLHVEGGAIVMDFVKGE